MNVLEYKGYHARIEFDSENFIIYGKIEGITDLVTFESESCKGIEEEFKIAVDDYLEFCKEVGKKPEKEYKGSFNVRIDPKLHRKLAIFSFKKNESLNHVVEMAIEEYISEDYCIKVSMQNTLSSIHDKLINNENNYTHNEYLSNGSIKYKLNYEKELIS